MEFRAFSDRVLSAGLQAKDCGNGHWRVLGGAVDVNFYPLSKNRTIYVNGTIGSASIAGGTVEKCVRLALEGPSFQREKESRKKNGGRKRRLYRESKACHWCRAPLTLETATVDHRIPLARGGSNNPNNLVLACEPCNHDKGSAIWPAKKE